MRLMIDTNIILDVFLERESFYEQSKEILTMCENKDIYGFVFASTATDIFYLVRKALNSTDEVYKALGNILNIVTRNKKDFITFGITLYSPEEIIEIIKK